MQRVDNGFVYSATDLNKFLECRRLTELDTLVAFKKKMQPPSDDEGAELIKKKGDLHEARYLAQLERQYPGDVRSFGRAASGIEGLRAAERETLDAMRSGVRIIYQATFFDGVFAGHADFLRRVETPSDLGGWSYEVIDTKLALSTKPYFLVQLCNYAEHLERLQGRMPERGYIVLGSGEEQGFLLHSYSAYYRRLKARFLEFAARPALASEDEPGLYPLKCSHCVLCSWNESCTKKRVDDDHLSGVAGMRRDQTAKLEAAAVTTIVALASAVDDVRPQDLQEKSFAKLRKQAHLQVRGRTEGPIYELLPHDPRIGFGLLPEPSAGDIYFDMEGDPMYEPGRGLEYLFGSWLPNEATRFVAFWGLDIAAEKRAFEAFIDFVLERRERYPDLHVYHYANYEKAALSRLAQQHATREDEVDTLLRAEVFVDLYTVVRQTLMISEDSYSIKRLEKFYGMDRTTEVKKGDQSIVMFEKWRVEGDRRILDDIERYNRDDCISTEMLHRWLLDRRVEAIAELGIDRPFRAIKEPDEPCHLVPFDGCKDCAKRLTAEREDSRRTDVERALLRENVPEAQFLAHLLAYHRREAKPEWWAYFDRLNNIDTLQEFDGDAIGGLEYAPEIPSYKLKPRDKNEVYAFRMPMQRFKLERGQAVDPLERTTVEIVEIDTDGGMLHLKCGGGAERASRIVALVPGPPIRTDAQEASLMRIAEAYLDGTLRGMHPATYDLLSAADPRTAPPRRVLQPAIVDAPSISEVVRSLDSSYLFIQGPPGTGKSTKGATVIADLLVAGKRVGVLSTGHKAIHHLLHKVESEMAERGKRFRGLYKYNSSKADSAFVSELATPFIESVAKNEEFDGGGYALAGGTSWLFAREQLTSTFDYLFIDEAGQVSLADALAVSTCAKNVVLLGDPSQLAQVGKGKHPMGADASALAHLLGEHATVPPTRGVFLDTSYRMHPEICAYVSESTYERRLVPGPDTAQHAVASPGLSGSGLRYLPVEHGGNDSSSLEEAACVEREVALLRTGTFSDFDGVARPITDAQIIVVTPYNAQRREIATRLRRVGSTVAVGTVDKFQGQEAPVVFYSMATSSAEDVPRDLEFLFEQNRFNVAVSRARAMSVLVCSPRLLDAPCRTPKQMELVNLLCAFVERVEGKPPVAG